MPSVGELLQALTPKTKCQEIWLMVVLVGTPLTEKASFTLASPHAHKSFFGPRSASLKYREATLFWLWKFGLFLLKKLRESSFSCICLEAARCCVGVIRGWDLPGRVPLLSGFCCCLCHFPCSAAGTMGCGCVSGDPGRAPQQPGLLSPACCTSSSYFSSGTRRGGEH